MRTELTATGSVDDYGDAKKLQIAQAFAAEVEGVEADDVRVTVVAGSVKIIVEFSVPAAKVDAVAAALAPKFATADDASTFLADADVTVESVDRRPVHYVESEESDDEMMHENEGGHYSGGSGGNSNMMMPRFGREEAEEDDEYDDEAYEAAEGAPSCEAPNTNGQPTLLEQLCSVAEQEHSAAAQMLSAFKQGF